MSLFTANPVIDDVTDADAAYMNHLNDGITATSGAAELALAEITAIQEQLGLNKPPGITNPGPRTGQVAIPTELLIVASNAAPAGGYAASGLPLGLNINANTGRISGTPSTVETATVNVTVSGPGGSSTVQFVWTISAAGAPTVTKPADQTAAVETPITPLQIETTGVTAYSATGLPAGVTINPNTGRITGTPTTAESPETTVTVKGPGGETTVKFKWVVSAATVLPAIRVGTEPKAEIATGTTLKAPEPIAGTVIGDLLLLLVHPEANTATVATPAGWTAIGTLGNITTHNFYVFWRIHDGTVMPTVTQSVSGPLEARILSVQGAESVDVQSGWTNQASSTTLSIASVTTTQANDLAIAITCKIAGASETTPAGWTQYNTKNQFRVFFKAQATAAATGATSATLGSAEASTAITFALKKTAAVAGITDKLSVDKKSVEPVSLPGETAFIRVARATAEFGQDENTRYETVAAGTAKIFGTVERPWVALQALNASSEPIGAFTARLKTTPDPVAPVLNKPATQNGNVGKAFSLQLTATESPTSYAQTGGTLPTSVTLNTGTGLISGTPTVAGTYKAKFTATNATGVSNVVEVEFVIGAASSTLTHGLVLNSDDTSTATLTAIAFGAPVVRDEFGIGTAASTVKERAEFMKSHGTLLQPLAGFNARIPTASEAKGLKAWAEALATLSPKPEFIEFGNETNYQITNNKANGKLYGERAKEAADAINGTGLKLLVQGSDAGAAGNTQWLDGLLEAWPKCWEHAAFGGWTIHAYPGSHVLGEKDTFGVPMMERLVKRLEEKGDTASKIFDSEWGVPCTSDGRTMTSGQSLNWAEGAAILEAHIGLLETASKKRMTQLLLYQAHDQQVEATSDTNREHYFGAVNSSGGAKGAFTTFAKAFL